MTKKLLPAQKAQRAPRRKLIPVPWQHQLRLPHTEIMKISIGAARVGLDPPEFIRVACSEKFDRDLAEAQRRSRIAHGSPLPDDSPPPEPVNYGRDGDPEST